MKPYSQNFRLKCLHILHWFKHQKLTTNPIKNWVTLHLFTHERCVQNKKGDIWGYTGERRQWPARWGRRYSPSTQEAFIVHVYTVVNAGRLTLAAAAVQGLWRRRVYSGPGRAGSWSRAWMLGVHGAWQGAARWVACTWQQAGIREEAQGDRLSVPQTYI